MKKILLESSALIEAARKKGRGDIRARVKAAMLSGQAVICEPVLLELMNGARGSKERKYIADLGKTLPMLTCGPDQWSYAITKAKSLRSRGKTTGNFDILIYAIAATHNCDILTIDKGFRLFAEN